MNQMLTAIDDDMLDQVSGGGHSVTLDPGAVVDAAAGATTSLVTGLVNTAGNIIKGIAGLLPVVSISWGSRG